MLLHPWPRVATAAPRPPFPSLPSRPEGNITTLHKLGDACASDHDQIQKLDLSGFEFDSYTADYESPYHITHQKKFPFQAESVSEFLGQMENFCKAIQQASPDSEQGAAALALP